MDPRRVLLIFAVCSFAIWLLDACVRDEATSRGDDQIYELMAQDPATTHTFPFAYRVLVPTIVHVLPFGHTFSFSLLAWLCSGGAGAITYVLLRRFAVREALAAAIGLILATSPGLLVVSLRDGRNTDAATVFLMLLAVLLMVDRRPRALAATLLVAALTRESAMFLVPLTYALWAARPVDVDAARLTAVVCAPAVTVYAALRLGIPTVGREQVLGYGEGLIEGRIENLRRGLDRWTTEGRRIFTQFGPLWLVAPLALRDTPFVRRGLVLFAGCLVSMTFALDWGRMMLLAAPVVVVAAGVVLQRHGRRVVVPVLVGCALLNVGYAVHMHRTGVAEGIDNNSLPPYPVR
ncbi:hypothetical protein DSM112329_02439 [Paraconexibacter sp. AEG42_29]|uniref:Glycosyltransferase RgtA/B/C/D-like domain-containing protein n=1 Tax=Paraconexibacter sp. AEG42_29 TaxID=2997339 RepID=A0AAU7AV66_9ACTN